MKRGIDFIKAFSPVARHSYLRILLAFIAINDRHLGQMDITTTFLHGDLNKMIIIAQLEGYINPKRSDHACHLKMSLYGVK